MNFETDLGGGQLEEMMHLTPPTLFWEGPPHGTNLGSVTLPPTAPPPRTYHAERDPQPVTEHCRCAHWRLCVPIQLLRDRMILTLVMRVF